MERHMKMTGSASAGSLVAGLLLAGPGVAAAAEAWEHTVVLYGVGASIDGTAGVGGVEADVDVSFGDILDNLEFGAMAAWRAERGPWAVLGDLIYMRLEQRKNGIGPAGETRATVDADQVIVELSGSYAWNDRWSTYAGLRFWTVDVDLQVIGGGPLGETLARSGDEDWVDPMVGVRYVQPLGERWSLVSKADVGGFGLGSDFAWQASVFADWRFADHASLLVGVRFLGIDYDDGSGAGRFLYDVTQGGPALGVAWQF
jgi:hypothetical protein